MSRELKISVGQHSDKGRKETNQDFHGVLVPEEPLLGLKGIAIVLADGISSSTVSRIAAESAVKGFLTDYYCTSEAWSVKTSAQRVLAATNSWLHAQTRRSQHAYDKDKGYVCTLSAMVIKSTTAHIFHVGDSRIYRVSGNALEQLTNDHRVIISSQQSYLGRALGVNPQIEIDYQSHQVEKGDVFVLATDGVYEHVSARFIAERDQGRRRRSRPGRQDHRRAGLRAGQSRQSHRPDRQDRCFTRRRGQRGVRPALRTAAAAAVGSADAVRRLPHRQGTACLQPQPHLSRGRRRQRRTGRAEDSVDRSARRSRLPEAVHDGGVGRPAHQQRPCAETLPAVAQAQLPLRRHRIHRRPDAGAMDDRQSEAGSGDHPRHRRADREGIARLPPQGNAASGPAAGQCHDRQDRDGEDHRFRFRPGHRRGRGVAAGQPRRYPRHLPVHRAGIFSGRERLAARRFLLARRHHLPDADGPAALWREDGADANEVAAAQTEIRHGAR